MWLEKFFRIKYSALIVSIFIMICGFGGIVVGLLSVYEDALIIIGQKEGVPGTYLIEAVDAFLFSLVILILAAGIFKLFVGTEDTFKNSQVFSKIKTFKDLKILLWETLLLTLTVNCFLDFIFIVDNRPWNLLILPASIVLLALALKLIKGPKVTSKGD